MKSKIIILLLIVLPVCLGAQDNTEVDSTGIATEQVEVIKNYEAIIQQAVQKPISPKTLDKNPIVINYKYDIQSEAKLDFERPDEVVRPLTFNESNRTEDIKDGSIYGGYGNLKTLTLGAAYHYYIEDWLEAGFKFDHMSANDETLPFQKFNNNEGQLYASYFLNKKTKLGFDALYRTSDHFTESPIPGDTTGASNQPIDQLGAYLNLSSHVFEKSGLSFRSRAGIIKTDQSQDSTTETRMHIELNIYKKINDKVQFELPFEFNNYSFEFEQLNTTEEISTSDFNIAPRVSWQTDRYNAEAGLQYINAKDTSFFFPILDFYFPEVFEEVDVHFYTASEFVRNGLSYLSGVNPYYRTDLSTYSPNFTASINLALIRQVQDFRFSLQASYIDYTGDDIHFDRSDTNRAVVSDLDRNEFAIQPSISFNKGILNAEINYRHNIFLGNQDNLLFYRPQSILGARLTQNLLGGKLKFVQDMRYVSSRKHAHPSDDDRLLDAYFDLSISADVVISKDLSVFARANNILAQEYQLWYTHPVFERQIWAGLRFNL